MRDIVIKKTFASNISGSVAVKLRPQLLVRSLVPSIRPGLAEITFSTAEVPSGGDRIYFLFTMS